MPDTGGYFRLKALAQYSGLSVHTLRGYLLHPARPLPHYRVGGKVLVKQSEFDVWMTAFRAETAPCVDAIVTEALGGL